MTSINRTAEQRAQFNNASFSRRMGAAFYDGLLLLALWMISTLVVIALNNRDAPLQGLIYQLFLYLESLLFFVYFWTFKGQTHWVCKSGGSSLFPNRANCSTRERPCFGTLSRRFLLGVSVLVIFGCWHPTAAHSTTL